jgi:hypothetical protein
VYMVDRQFRDRAAERYCSDLPHVGPGGFAEVHSFGRCFLAWGSPSSWDHYLTVGGRACCMDEASQWSCAALQEEPEALHDRRGTSFWTGSELVVWGGQRAIRLHTSTWVGEEGTPGWRSGPELLEGYILRPAPVPEGTGVPMFRCDANGRALEVAPAAESAGGGDGR